MNPLVIIVGVFLFVSGIVLGRQSQSPSSKIFDFTKSLQVTKPALSPTPTETVTPTVTISSAPTDMSTKTTPKPSNIPTAQPSPQASGNVNFSDFEYPGSGVTSQTSTTLILKSNDSPDSITTWYQNKIRELGFTARSSAKTNSNGNIENKIGGGKANGSVTIDIKKSAFESVTVITVATGVDNSSDVHIKIENNQGYL